MKRPRATSSSARPPLDDRLTLRLLGEPALVVADQGGTQQRLLGVGKPLALLTYLAVTPQREASREFLADLLWADGSVADPAHSLRNALVSLRTTIDRGLIDATPTRCRLTRPVASDLDALTAALRDGRTRDALAFYSGDFFLGFAAPGCMEFEHWCDSVRHRVRSDVVNAADVLVRQLLDEGHARDAAAVARRMIEIEPTAQRSRRALIEALVAAGDDPGALTEVAVVQRWLHSEGLTAEPATAAIVAHVRRDHENAHRACGASEAPLTPDLVGREPEFAEIVQAWERARTGGPAFVAVTATAGVGKSRLLVDAANRLRAERARVVAVNALQSERDMPFALFTAVAAALAPFVEARAITPSAARILAGLDPALAERYETAADTNGVDLVRRRALALRELLVSAADRRPTALVFDDVHYCDEASAEALLAALARLTDANLLVVAASRPGARQPLPAEHTRIVTLHPLNAEQTGQLIASIRPLPDAPWGAELCRAVHVASGGVPLFAILALRNAQDASVLRAGEQAWESQSPDALVRFVTEGSVASRSVSDLSPIARRVLAYAALGRRELPWPLLAALFEGPGRRDLDIATGEIERRALLTRHGNAVAVAHDLVADAVLAGAADDERAAWKRELAAAMIATADLKWIERGVRLARAAVEPAQLAVMLAPVLHRLSDMPGQSVARRIDGWLGPSESMGDYSRRVARHLPLRLRLRPYRGRLRTGAAALVLVTAALGWRFAHPGVEPDGELRILTARGAGTVEVLSAPMTLRDWSPAEDIAGRTSVVRGDSGQIFGTWTGASTSLVNRSRLVEQVFGDSGESEVTAIDARGIRHRLTNSPGDDVPEAWSPDGRYVLFSSSRWSEMRHHQLAILDTRTGAVRPLGKAGWPEGNGIWSPDGSRIAFQRRFLDGRAAELCAVDFDGADERCMTRSGWRGVSLLGWADGRIILANASSDSATGGVWAMLPDSGWRAIRLQRGALAPALSPNGQLLAWRQGVDAAGGVFVAPLSDLGRVRRVRLAMEPGADVSATWSTRGLPAPYVNSLTLQPIADTIPVGVPHRPYVMAWWSDGHVSRPMRVRWSVASGDATVDSAGTIVAGRPGIIVVNATLGGWRSTSHRFFVSERPVEEILQEHWENPIARWRFFGVPTPKVVPDASLGTALSNEGDGSYFSGAYLVQTLRAAHGLAIDAVLRTPVTEVQWQALGVFLNTLADSAELSRWDHRSGYMPNLSVLGGLTSCGLQYPVGDGLDARRHITSSLEPPVGDAFDARALANGWPWRLRLQLFPDGRCGVAVNGHPIGISAQRVAPLQPLLLLTSGKAWHTQMLLGALTISRGVPNDIDWTARLRSPSRAPRRTTPRPPE